MFVNIAGVGGACANTIAEDHRAMEAVGILPDGVNSTPRPPTSDRDSGYRPYTPPPRSGRFLAFYPPMPPLYGSVVPEPTKAYTFYDGRNADAPDELADFVGEIFYPALGTRLFDGSVTGKVQDRLDAYRKRRAALLDALIGKLLELQAAPAEEREAALRAFAPQQEADLAALEAEAEHLRHDLVQGGLFSRKLDWNKGRSWRLGHAAVAKPPLKPEAEFQVARATAFFEDGLSIEQRGLLRELAMESARLSRFARRRPPQPDDDPAAVFFSPETARFRMPSPLPTELFTQIGQYNTEKADLKRELMETVIKLDPLPHARRSEWFSNLAFAQARKIDALEKQAEEIRRGLAALPEPKAPWVPPIPPELQERIKAYNRERSTLLAAYARAQSFHTAVTLRPSLALSAAGAHEERATSLANARARALAEFETANAELIETLQNRYQRIHEDLDEIARNVEEPVTHRIMTVETLLQAHRLAMQRFDAIGREEAMYERYKIAMLQPGLSPGQRRLLFRAAHAGLAQPLPTGELNLAMSRGPVPRS